MALSDDALAGRGRSFWGSDMRKVLTFVRDEAGTETLEWGLVCGMIVLATIVAINTIGPKVTEMWNDMNEGIPEAD